MLIRGINFYLFVLISVIVVLINDIKEKRQNKELEKCWKKSNNNI